MSEFENVKLLRRSFDSGRSLPVLRLGTRTVPGLARTQLRPVHHHGPPGGHGDLRRSGVVPAERPALGNLLVVQRREWQVREVLVALRGRRRQRHHCEVPGRAALQRPAPLVRPAEPHGTSSSPHAADHAEAPQGERGLHVAVRRSPHRSVHRRRFLRDGRRLRGALHPDRHRRPRGGARVRPLPLPGAAVHGTRGRLPQAARVPLRAVLRVHRGPPPANPATTF